MREAAPGKSGLLCQGSWRCSCLCALITSMPWRAQTAGPLCGTGSFSVFIALPPQNPSRGKLKSASFPASRLRLTSSDRSRCAVPAADGCPFLCPSSKLEFYRDSPWARRGAGNASNFLSSAASGMGNRLMVMEGALSRWTFTRVLRTLTGLWQMEVQAQGHTCGRGPITP